MNKEHLGDDVYAQMDETTHELILTTRDGDEVHDAIILSPLVVGQLLVYIKTHYPGAA
jgi:hypothetical protein